MNVAQVTKIVSACLILAACHERAPKNTDGVGSTTKAGIGVESKAGKMITRGQWCRPLKTDANGIMRREQFQFRANGSFRRSLSVVNQDATMTKESLEKGNWAIIDGQLLFMLDGNTLKMDYSEYTRTNDGVTCLKIVAEGAAVEGNVPLCPCES